MARPPATHSEARDRLLGKASEVFYTQGIHAIGVDRLIAEAGITRATFYRHFPSKEDLVLAYLREADQTIRRHVRAAAVGEPADAVRAVAASIAEDIRSKGFRGCAFLNAAAEYPNPGDPVNQAVIAHRQWFLETITGLMAGIDADKAEAAAQHFVMLRDGAMASGCLFAPDMVAETFLRGVDGLVRLM
ncbi:TetR/AcrR family transcriptional regulator [Paractinoplanes deccanensis]|nr:TetR/AcrR family transcriptional regulator [Actinoplanes deccanensis]